MMCMYNSLITVYAKVHARAPIPALDTNVMYLINRLMDLEHQITLNYHIDDIRNIMISIMPN